MTRLQTLRAKSSRALRRLRSVRLNPITWTPLPDTGGVSWRAALTAQLPVVLRQEGARWGFVLRAILAAFMALGVSMLLELDQPSTAMLTSLIVMQPQSGAVLSKSVFRVLGNFAGGAVAVLLFFLFAQQVPLLLIGLALWVGLCTAGSARQRNAQSYGFVLSGYTACIIALPALSSPANIFDIAVLRVSEVFVGIVCAALTTESIFPSTIQDVLFAAARGRFAAFDDFVRVALSGGAKGFDAAERQLRFIQDVATLDNYGASASFEAGGAMHNRRVRLFNAGFMAVSSSFYSLCIFMRKHLPAARKELEEFFHNQAAFVATSMAVNGKSAHSAEEALAVAKTLADCRETLNNRLNEYTDTTPLYPEERRILESGTHLLHRFLDDMRAYLLHYADLSSPVSTFALRTPHFAPSTDASIALVSGLRAVALLLAVCLFWHLSNWEGGSNTAIFAVVFCALQAAAPNPSRSIFYSCLGCVYAIVAGIAFGFGILPHMTEFVPLCSALFPFLAIGPYLLTIPQTAGIGRSYNFMFASFANPGLALSIDPVTLVSGAFAKLTGLILAGCMIAVFLPPGGVWWKNRLRRGLLREISTACQNNLDNALFRLESGVRDLLLQFITSSAPSRLEKRTMLQRSMAAGNLGRAIIEIRQGIAQGRYSEVEKELLRSVLTNLSTFLIKPDFDGYRSILDIIQRAAQSLGNLEPPETLAAHAEPPLSAARPDTASPRSRNSFAPNGAATILRIMQQILMHMDGELRMFHISKDTGGKEVNHAA